MGVLLVDCSASGPKLKLASLDSVDSGIYYATSPSGTRFEAMSHRTKYCCE